jgi:hypothetical protein
MKEKIKSEFEAKLNGVAIKSQTNYYYFRDTIKQFEKFYDITIDDTDFVIFMQRFTEECFKYVTSIDPATNVVHIVSSFLTTYFVRNDVDFKKHAVEIGNFFEKNKEIILNQSKSTQRAYTGFDGYDLVLIKAFEDVDSKTLKSLEKYIPDYDGIEIENYADLIDIFKLRFKNR